MAYFFVAQPIFIVEGPSSSTSSWAKLSSNVELWHCWFIERCSRLARIAQTDNANSELSNSSPANLIRRARGSTMQVGHVIKAGLWVKTERTNFTTKINLRPLPAEPLVNYFDWNIDLCAPNRGTPRRRLITWNNPPSSSSVARVGKGLHRNDCWRARNLDDWEKTQSIKAIKIHFTEGQHERRGGAIWRPLGTV